MITAVALDDEPIALDIVDLYAAKVPFIKLKAKFTDAFEALDYLHTECIDLLFLDINMPDILGIDFIHILRKRPMVIFITGYAEHAVKSFELDAIDYLLKPFSLPRFIKACDKALELQQLKNKEEKDDFIFLKTGYEHVKIQFEDIYYLESGGNYINFILKDKNVLSRMTFAELTTILPENKFIRVHRCYIAAINKIDKIERHQIKIREKNIPIGENYLLSLTSLSSKKI